MPALVMMSQTHTAKWKMAALTVRFLPLKYGFLTNWTINWQKNCLNKKIKCLKLLFFFFLSVCLFHFCWQGLWCLFAWVPFKHHLVDIVIVNILLLYSLYSVRVMFWPWEARFKCNVLPGIVPLMKDCPHKRLPSQKTTLARDHWEGRPLSWETTLMRCRL